jgi:hypothetical protein
MEIFNYEIRKMVRMRTGDFMGVYGWAFNDKHMGRLAHKAVRGYPVHG